MKVLPEKIICEGLNFVKNKNVFLINGNEETYIEKITKLLIVGLRKNNFFETSTINNAETISQTLKEIDLSLFSEKKILIFKSLKKIDIEKLSSEDLNNFAIIIVDYKIKNSSKIKKFFDSSNELISISCYKLTKENKIKISEHFFSINNISMQKDSYWFFLDNSDDRYMIFENEIQKITDFAKKDISISDLKELLSIDREEAMDSLFFLVLRPNSEIVKKTQSTIVSLSESFVLLQRVKFYTNLFISSKNQGSASQDFPSYLFMEKQKYLSIYKKITNKKISKIMALVNKTDLLLKRNSNLFLPIIQRFLLNLKKSLG